MSIPTFYGGYKFIAKIHAYLKHSDINLIRRKSNIYKLKKAAGTGNIRLCKGHLDVIGSNYMTTSYL